MKSAGYLSVSILALVVTGCDSKSSNGTSNSETKDNSSMGSDGKSLDGTPAKINFNLHPLHKVVCDPFDEGGDQSLKNGLKASLYYLSAGQPAYENVDQIIANGTKSEKTLFLPDVNVRTRLFDQGFTTLADDVIKDDQDNKLIEWFALNYESSIKLTSADEPGLYEFSLLADDGAVLEILEQGQWKTLINNNGLHPTRMGCSNRYIEMTATKELPIRLRYYQGPRYHISNIVLWRKINEADADVTVPFQADALCGKTSNSSFFDPDHNSTPNTDYIALVSRGWTPVPKENYFLPQDVSYNPCTTVADDPVVTNFKIIEILSNDVILSWVTDIPASSQVKYTDASGVTKITDSDNQLRTMHTVILSDLQAGATYKIQALSLTEEMGKGIGPETTITTQH